MEKFTEAAKIAWQLVAKATASKGVTVTSEKHYDLAARLMELKKDTLWEEASRRAAVLASISDKLSLSDIDP